MMRNIEHFFGDTSAGFWCLTGPLVFLFGCGTYVNSMQEYERLRAPSRQPAESSDRIMPDREIKVFKLSDKEDFGEQLAKFRKEHSDLEIVSVHFGPRPIIKAKEIK